MKKIFNIIKTILRNIKSYQLIILIVFIFIIANIYSSSADHHNEAEFDLINSKIGKVIDDDYALLVYVEDDSSLGSYYLTESIPLEGYVYSGYNCKNDSTLLYDDINKTTTITTNIRDLCSIYFNIIE